MPFRLRALFEEFFETKESCAAFRRGLGNLSKDSVPRSRFTAVYIHGDVKELRGNLRCELRRTFLRSFFQCFVNPAHRPPENLRSQVLLAADSYFLFGALAAAAPPLLAITSNVGTRASTGSRSEISTSRSVYRDLSLAAIRYTIPSPRTSPPPNPPPAKYDFFGKDGLLGRVGGSRTLNCSLCCWCSRSLAIPAVSRLLSKPL